MKNDENDIYIATSNYYLLFTITIIIFIMIIGIIIIILLLLLLLLWRFVAFAKAVFNAKIFLLGELQLVTKGQEDAFTLHF